jgi:hypothetical protein
MQSLKRTYTGAASTNTVHTPIELCKLMHHSPNGAESRRLRTTHAADSPRHRYAV